MSKIRVYKSSRKLRNAHQRVWLILLKELGGS